MSSWFNARSEGRRTQFKGSRWVSTCSQPQSRLQCRPVPSIAIFQKRVCSSVSPLRGWLIHWIVPSHWPAFLYAKCGCKAMTLSIKLRTYTSKCLLALCVVRAGSCGFIPPPFTAQPFFKFFLQGCLSQQKTF